MGTVWTAVEETLARLDSMDAGAAAGDAAEIRRIVAAARAVSERLATAFGGSDVLSGSAADASTASGTALAAQVGASVEGLQTGAGALDAASSALSASIGQRERIAGLAGAESMPEIRGAVSSALQGLMTGSYNMPMSSSTSGIVDVGSSGPTSGSGTTNSGNDVGSTPSNGYGPVESTLRSGTGTADPANTPATVAPTGNGPSRTESVRDTATTNVGAPDTTGGVTPSPTTTDAADRGTDRQGSDPAGSGPSPSGPGVVAPLVSPGVVRPQSAMSGVLGAAPGARVAGLSAVGGPTPTNTGVRTPIAPGSSTATQAAAASTAARSTSATPAMGSGAVRRKDDDSYSSASYLRSTREGELLLGTPPMVTSAVIPQPIVEGDGLPVNAGEAVAANSADADADQKLDPTL